jgi:hypothetical protein
LHLSLLLLLSLRIARIAGFAAPTARAAFENVSVMQQAIQQFRKGSISAKDRFKKRALGDHSKAAIDYHFKTGHREMA